MITFLKVRNLAIVEEFAIEPGAGLNVLTGETGAGKSLLIDSLQFLSGARGSTDSIRSGADRMAAEAIFVLPHEARALIEPLGIESEGDDGRVELVVRREITSSGRGKVFVNGSPLTVRELQQLMDAIVEVHGQEQAHTRVAGRSARELLDSYAGNDAELEQTAAAYEQLRTAQEALDALSTSERERRDRLDLLRYQIDEISASRLQSGEEESLRSERARLANAQEIIEAASTAYARLADDDAAVSQLARASQSLSSVARAVPDLDQTVKELDDLRFRAEEISREIARTLDSVRVDPRRLDEVEERLVVIERLSRKYGGSVEAVLEHLTSSQAEEGRLLDYESSLTGARSALDAAVASYEKRARLLSESRVTAARALEQEIERQLEDLAMKQTRVRIELTTHPAADSPLVLDGSRVAIGSHGFDHVAILVAPNRGDDPRPLQRVASGGELSRIQLAIATALFRAAGNAVAATLVFDEIDAGIGGRVADAIGKKLQELARSNQVICVTHLPQIASFGTTHFRVWKEDRGGRTTALIERLDQREERIEEIARMLGGEQVADSARRHAGELLERAADSPVRKRSTGANVV